MSTKDVETIKALREQILALKKRNDELEAQFTTENVNHEAIGMYKDDKGNYHRVIIGYNPEVLSVKILNDEIIGTTAHMATYRTREYMEMKILKKEDKR
jgi:hypothetical protein